MHSCQLTLSYQGWSSFKGIVSDFDSIFMILWYSLIVKQLPLDILFPILMFSY
jgi:hypothetical protein